MALVLLAVTLAILSVALVTRSVEAAFPGKNGRIAFERRLDDNADFEIMTAKRDGSGLKQVTDNGSHDRYPNWSANGRKLAFVSDRDGDEEIYVVRMRDNGTPADKPIRITDNGSSERDPAFSPDGTRIAYSGSDFFSGPEILTIKSDGSGTPTRVTNNGAEDYEPNWSPDGASIAYSKLTLVPSPGGGFFLVHDVYTTEAAGGGQETQITTTGSAGDPNWSPDGQQLVYRNGFDIYVINADGSGVPRRVVSGSEPAFSPDGQRIVFRSDTADIFKIRAGATTGTGRQITSGSSSDDYPDWQSW